MTEAMPHYKAKIRLYNLVSNTSPQPTFIDVEREYPNPFHPDYPWRFDVYFEIDDRKVALEVDDKIGHSSPKSFKKRQHKIAYLKTKGIELFAWPRKWILGRKAYPDQVFLEELRLLPGTNEQIEVPWYYK